jgi:hypothetical protein
VLLPLYTHLWLLSRPASLSLNTCPKNRSRRIQTHETDAEITDLAVRIVRDMFCFCISDEPDAASGHPASIHQAVAAEIIARASRMDTLIARNTHVDHRIDDASTDSFPASALPAWIYSH